MDALSLATSIIQFIDFASGLVGKGIEIHQSTTGLTIDHNVLGDITNSLVACSTEIGKSKQHQKGASRAEWELQHIATKCQNVAEELLGVLEPLKSKGRRTRWESFRKLLKASWQEEKIQTLEARLERYRQQMVVTVLNSLRNQSYKAMEEQISIRESIQRIEERQRNTISVGDQFVRQLAGGDQWRRHVIQAIREQDPGVARGANWSFFRGPDGEKPEAVVVKEEWIQSRILKQLAFHNMSDRERRISKAHGKTFEWIFHDNDDVSTSAPLRFRHFLRCSEEKIYWITGKPGSGKSTLMKFIRHRAETTDIMRDWADGGEIIQAAYYFWNSGVRMQMTVEGLLQTILHECFDQLRWAIQEVVPERWEIATLFDYDESTWTLEGITQALKKLFSEVCPEKKFFLLIDGLDECCGDQTRLIELIAELAQECDNLKLCVASRPWTNFEDAFRSRPSLMLQDLTLQDIKHYIKSKFNNNVGFVELQNRDPFASDKLLDDISKKAQGVFLWVQLVVQSLLEGLTNGDRVRDLERRLAELPPGLEELYAKILESLNSRYLEHASQLFQIVRTHRGSPTLLCLAFADLEDNRKALKAPTMPLSSTEIFHLCKNMKRKLTSRCLGLLDTASNNYTVQHKDAAGPGGADLEVQYLHRSVRDYIEDPKVWDWLLLANKEPFDPHLVLLKASLLQLKQDHRWPTARTFFFRTLTAIKHACGSLDGRQYRIHGKKREIIHLLDELDKTGCSLTTLNGDTGQVFSDRCGTLNGEHWSSLLLSSTDRPSFLHVMTVCGVSQYLKRRLRRSSHGADGDNENRMPLLLTALIGDISASYSHVCPKFARPGTQVLKVIMETGASCHQKWQGTSAWMVAERSNNASIMELFRNHGGEPPVDASKAHRRTSGKSRGDTDKESTISTEAVYGKGSKRKRSTPKNARRKCRQSFFGSLRRRPASLHSHWPKARK